MKYIVEITDTFGGEANYSWVTRHIIVAKSIRGVLQKLSKASGVHWRGVGGGRWDSRSGATCAFVELFDEDDHRHLDITSNF